MRRFLRLVLHAGLIMVVAIVSFIVVDKGTVSISGDNGATLFNGAVAGACGLVLGLVLAWIRRVPWRLIPVLWRHWMQRAAHEFWWTAAAATSIAVLLFY